MDSEDNRGHVHRRCLIELHRHLANPLCFYAPVLFLQMLGIRIPLYTTLIACLVAEGGVASACLPRLLECSGRSVLFSSAPSYTASCWHNAATILYRWDARWSLWWVKKRGYQFFSYGFWITDSWLFSFIYTWCGIWSFRNQRMISPLFMHTYCFVL